MPVYPVAHVGSTLYSIPYVVPRLAVRIYPSCDGTPQSGNYEKCIKLFYFTCRMGPYKTDSYVVVGASTVPSVGNVRDPQSEETSSPGATIAHLRVNGYSHWTK